MGAADAAGASGTAAGAAGAAVSSAIGKKWFHMKDPSLTISAHYSGGHQVTGAIYRHKRV